MKAYGFYEHAAGEDAATYTTSAPGTSGYVAASANALHYDPINFYQFGVAVTTGGPDRRRHLPGRPGQQPAWPSIPTGGAPMGATVFGLTYLNGPWTVGSAVGIINSQGNANLNGISQRHQFETAIGGNYKLAPGVNLVLEYDYYQTHQGDFNFATNVRRRRRRAYNDVKGQALFFSTVLTW